MRILPLYKVDPVPGGVYVGINRHLEEAIYHYCSTKDDDVVEWRDADMTYCDKPPLAVAQINDESYDACEVVSKQLNYLNCEGA